MAARNAFRYVSRWLSSSGKVLSEEEKAAENVYIKKMKKEKLEKLARKKMKKEKLEKFARKGPKPEEQAATSAGGSGSNDCYYKYDFLAGLVSGVGAGWCFGFIHAVVKGQEDRRSR